MAWSTSVRFTFTFTTLAAGDASKIAYCEYDGIAESKIASMWNERHVSTDCVRAWTHGTVHHVLTNEKYLGNNIDLSSPRRTQLQAEAPLDDGAARREPRRCQTENRGFIRRLRQKATLKPAETMG
jgi:Recombinase